MNPEQAILGERRHLTRIKRQFIVYFCLHRGEFAGKHCKMASSLSTSNGRTIWIVNAHGYGKRFIVRSDEMLTVFVELETAIHEFAVSLIL